MLVVLCEIVLVEGNDIGFRKRCTCEEGQDGLPALTEVHCAGEDDYFNEGIDCVDA